MMSVCATYSALRYVMTTDMTLFFLCAGPAVAQDKHTGRIT